MEGSGQSGAPANIREAFTDHWVLTTSLWEDGSDGRGFGPSPPAEWGPSPWEQEVLLCMLSAGGNWRGVVAALATAPQGLSPPRESRSSGSLFRVAAELGGNRGLPLSPPSLVFAPSLPLSLFSSRLPL